LNENDKKIVESDLGKKVILENGDIVYLEVPQEDYQFILYLNDDRSKSDSLKIVKADEVNFRFEYHGKNNKKQEKTNKYLN
jgi:hypothetical protein